MKRATRKKSLFFSLKLHAHYVMNDKKQGTAAAQCSSLMLFEIRD